jgi:hypothetical protein
LIGILGLSQRRRPSPSDSFAADELHEERNDAADSGLSFKRRIVHLNRSLRDYDLNESGGDHHLIALCDVPRMERYSAAQKLLLLELVGKQVAHRKSELHKRAECRRLCKSRGRRRVAK